MEARRQPEVSRAQPQEGPQEPGRAWPEEAPPARAVVAREPGGAQRDRRRQAQRPAQRVEAVPREDLGSPGIGVKEAIFSGQADARG